MKAKWSDGSEFVLEVGQIWEDKVNGEVPIRIFSLNHDGTVTAGPLDDELWNSPIEGTDGFIDFLESNCYTLKQEAT